MKTQTAAWPPLVVLAAIALSQLQSAVSEEKAVSETPDRSVLRAVPIKDHWNANSWDPTGGSLFWHALEDRKSARPDDTKGRNTRRPAATSSEAAISGTNRR